MDELISLVKGLKETIMATAQELTDAFGAIDASVNKLGDDLTKTLADLTAAVKAGNVDLSPFVARANTIAQKLTDFDTTVVTADAGMTPPPSAPTV